MKSFWKHSVLSLTALSLIGVPSIFTQAAEQPIQVTINGAVQTFATTPYFRNNRAMVPLRAIAEQLGATVNWSADRPDFVTVQKGPSLLQVEIGSKHALLNGKEVQLDQAPELINHTVMGAGARLGGDVGCDRHLELVDAHSGTLRCVACTGIATAIRIRPADARFGHGDR